MTSATTSLEEVDRMLDSMGQGCERLDLLIEQISEISPEQAEKLVKKAKSISHRLRVFERRMRDLVGLVTTNPARGRQGPREGN